MIHFRDILLISMPTQTCSANIILKTNDVNLLYKPIFPLLVNTNYIVKDISNNSQLLFNASFPCFFT